MNKNIRLAKRYGAKTLPFRKLSKESRYAMIHYMAIDGEAWKVSDELADAFVKGHNTTDEYEQQAIHKKALMKSSNIAFYMELYGDCKFGYVQIPTQELLKTIWKRDYNFQEDEMEYQDFLKYMKDQSEVTNHSSTNRWPVILGSSDDEVLEDGWHRFQTYVQMKCRTIPCIFYIDKEDYLC